MLAWHSKVQDRSVHCPRSGLVHAKHQEDDDIPMFLWPAGSWGCAAPLRKCLQKPCAEAYQKSLLCSVPLGHTQASSEISHPKTTVLSEFRGEQIRL